MLVLVLVGLLNRGSAIFPLCRLECIVLCVDLRTLLGFSCILRPVGRRCRSRVSLVDRAQ